MSFFDSPQAFARACVRLAAALAIIGLAGLVDRMYVFPLAGLLLAFAALTWLVASDLLDDPPAPPNEPVSRTHARSAPVSASAPVVASPKPAMVAPVELEPARADSPTADVPVGDSTTAVVDDEPSPQPNATPPMSVRRTFRLPASVGAEAVWLVGDFNGWSSDACLMRRAGDWFTITIDLERGQVYRYRYLLDGVRWDADEYAPNEYGTEDSVART